MLKQKMLVGLVCLPCLFPTLVQGQICLSNVEPSTPTSQFTRYGDGTVTDNKTGLMWKICHQGETWNDTSQTCEGQAILYDWEGALSQVRDNNNRGGFAGHTDWRLPNIKELRSLIETSCVGPNINQEIFPTTNAHYRSYISSSPAFSTNDIWTVSYTDFPTNAINGENSAWNRKDTRFPKNESAYLVRFVRN